MTRHLAYLRRMSARSICFSTAAAMMLMERPSMLFIERPSVGSGVVRMASLERSQIIRIFKRFVPVIRTMPLRPDDVSMNAVRVPERTAWAMAAAFFLCLVPEIRFLSWMADW